MKRIAVVTSCLFAAFCGAMVAAGEVLPNAWVVEPSLSKPTWTYQTDDPATISLGEPQHGTVVCDYTDEQLAALAPGYYRVTFTVAPDETYGGLVKRLFVKVTNQGLSLTGELSSDRKALTVMFEADVEERDLILCAGDFDAGRDITAWAINQPVAKIPAGATSAHVPLVGFGTEFALARVFLRPAKMKNLSLGYAAPERLIAQWDGEDNAAYGVHDATRTSPCELTGHVVNQVLNGSIPAGDKYFDFGAGHLAFDSAEIRDAIIQGSLTVELVLDGNGNALGNNAGIVGFGSATVNEGSKRGLWVYQKNNLDGRGFGMIGDVSYHGGSVTSVRIGSERGRNTFSFNLGPTTETSILYQNGEQWGAIARDDTYTAGTDCYLGKIGTFERANVRVYSIRVYDKQLTADEMAQNLDLDELRFADEEEALQMSQLFAADDALVIRKISADEKKVPTSIRVAFPVATATDRARSLAIVWGRKDKGENLQDWGDSCLFVGSIPSGVAAMEVELPAEARVSMNSRTGFRAIIGSKPSARAYAASGNLIAQWDGMENAGYGVHDATRTYPLELKGRVVNPTLNGTLPAADDYFEFGSGSLSFRLPGLVSAINEGHATVELTMTSMGDFAEAIEDNGGLFILGDTTRGLWMYQQKLSDKDEGYFVGGISYHAPRQGSVKSYNIARPEGAFDTWTVSMGANTASSQLFASNESLGNLTRFSTALSASDDICHLGELFWNNVSHFAKAKVHSIRIYDKQLTDEERAQNVLIDTLRFKGTGEAVCSPFVKLPCGFLLMIL